MQPEIRNDFRLNFITSLHGRMTINIPHANENALDSEVRAAMEAIVASGVVMSSRGEPLFLYDAELVTTNRRDFDIA